MVKEIYKGSNSPFATRLRELMAQHGAKQSELAELLGVTRQSIGQYADGTSLPPVDKIIELANYYKVTTDYILGLTDVASTDAELRSVCEYTGLNEKVIKKLHKTKVCDKGTERKILEKIIDVILELKGE